MAARNETLRNLVEQEEIAVLPGCYDALTAKIIQKSGFNAAYIIGAGISNTKLGLADVGLTSFGEMRDHIQYIVEAVDIPVFADADTGYGNPLHVQRTVKAYEQAGVSALHIEDQKFPKKCGHFEDKKLISEGGMVAKIKAAVDARTDENFLICARTDARAVDGVDAAIQRANVYVEAGADMVFPEAPQSKAEMKRFCQEIKAPVMANMVEYGKTPLLSVEELQEMGYDLVIFPNTLLRAAMLTMLKTAERLKKFGDVNPFLEDIATFDLRNELTDYASLKRLEEQYAAEER